MFITLMFGCSFPSLFPLGDGDDAYTATTDFSGIWVAPLWNEPSGSTTVEMSDQCQMLAGNRDPSSVKKLSKPQAVGAPCAVKKAEGVVIKTDSVGRCTGLGDAGKSYSTCLRTDGMLAYEAGTSVPEGCACPTGGLGVEDREDMVIAVLRVGKSGRYRVGGKRLLHDVPRTEQVLDPETWLDVGLIEAGDAVYGDVALDAPVRPDPDSNDLSLALPQPPSLYQLFKLEGAGDRYSLACIDLTSAEWPTGAVVDMGELLFIERKLLAMPTSSLQPFVLSHPEVWKRECAPPFERVK